MRDLIDISDSSYSIDSIREEIESEQNSFVSAMVGKGAVPKGFDHYKFKEAASILARKRMNAVKKAFPGIAGLEGFDFNEEFALYSRTRTQPRYNAALLDGRLFARFLEKQNPHHKELKLIINRFDRLFFVRGKRLYKKNRLQQFLFDLKRKLFL